MTDFIVINEKLKYADNYLDEKLIESINQKILHYGAWTTQLSSLDNTQDKFFWAMALSNNPFFEEEIKELQLKINKKFLRVYVNGQTIGQHGSFHQDDGEETHLIGLNKDFSILDSGATEFLANNQTSFCIYPLYNRVIVFDAKLEHRALPTITNIFRKTLAIKTIE